MSDAQPARMAPASWRRGLDAGTWRRNDALVHHRRPLRRDRGQDPYHLPPAARLDRRSAPGGAAARSAALDSTLFIVLIFACVVLHEFGHILAARRYGIRRPTVTLLPIGGVASMERLPTNPRQELVVALAGPAVNLVIGLVLVLALGTAAPGRARPRSTIRNLSLIGRLAAANIFLAVFNLIPAFPMDGGRVLHALIAMRIGGARATEIAARIGQAFALGLGFLGLFGNPLLHLHRHLRLYRRGRERRR